MENIKVGDARCLPPVAQQDLRIKAVRLVLAGRQQKEVAQVFGVTEQIVCRWMKRYHARGIRGLWRRPRGRPRGGRLEAWQCAQIARAVIDRTPDQLRLPFYLWTRAAVAQLIVRRFGVRYSLMQVGRYLQRWGFTPQKPVRRAYEQDSGVVARWLRVVYPAIQRRAKQEGAVIHWGDETGMRSDQAAGRSYGRRGRTPVVPGTGRRFGCNLISAITNRGRLRFMVFRERFCARIFMRFLDRLVKDVGQKVYCIVDQHPVHKAQVLKRWLFRRRHRLALFYLPGYSPELNPDEMLNQDVKCNAVGKQRPHTRDELMRNVRGYLWSRQRRPDLVMRYFHEEHVRYAAG